MKLSRRRLLAGATAGLAAPAILHWPANAAEFTYKCGASLPDGHPMAVRAREAMAQIKEESGGRLDITLYTNSVLGGDTAMISQTIPGRRVVADPLHRCARRRPRDRRRYPLDLDRVSLIEHAPDR
jgi:TRAP-type C4-dicarboxylate transport system substrate-binding protein